MLPSSSFVPLRMFGPFWSIFSQLKNYDRCVIVGIGSGVAPAVSVLATILDSPILLPLRLDSASANSFPFLCSFN